MLILEGDKPFGIILHPKTGSMSIREALKWDAEIGGHHGYDENTCQSIINDGGIVCSVVRNPWDIMVSWYFYNQKREHNPQYPKVEPFDEWLPRTLEAGNGWIEKGLFYGAGHCNQTIKFEFGIELQLNKHLIDCGLDPVNLKRVNSTEHEHYSHYYNVELSNKVFYKFTQEVVDWDYFYFDAHLDRMIP